MSTNLLDNRMQKLNSEAELDFKLDDYSLKEKALASPNIKIKWTRILAEEQKLLKVIEQKLEEYRKSVLSSSFDINLAQFKKDIALEADEGVIKIKAAIDNQKDMIRFVEGVLKIAHSFGYDIKNCIDLLKLEQ